jgi:hypothetical protein
MLTNFFRIAIPFESFHIQRTAYTDKMFASLRKAHNRDASFFRHDEFIYVSPRKGSGLAIGQIATLNVKTSPEVVRSLILHLVFRSFRDAFPDRIPESFSPLRFFSTRDEQDGVRRFLPSDL